MATLLAATGRDGAPSLQWNVRAIPYARHALQARAVPVTPTRTVACPTCGKQVEWTPASKWRPFCSERCKLIDFGAWASESFRIPAVEDDDEATPQPPADERG
jgi:endogenous inhibitor of DNA gyrase (YacG/DUF329 family)